MSPNFDLRQLRYFVAIVESGSLSAAARSLHVAQPALSHHLKGLEGALGQALLVRQARGVQVTPAGDRLFRYAVGLLRQAQGLRSAIADDQAVAGPVAIGLPRTVTGLLALPLFQRVLEQHPGIVLEIFDGHSRDLGRQLQEGRIDLAVMMAPGPPQDAREAALVREELVIVGPVGAEWMPAGRTMSLQQLTRLPTLLPSRRERLHALLAQLGLPEKPGLDVRGHIDDPAVLLAAVRAGHGATVLPWSAASQALREGWVESRSLRGRVLKRQLLLCRNSLLPLRDSTAAVAMAFTQVVEEAVSTGAWATARYLRPNVAQFLSPAPRRSASASATRDRA